uniref:Uncharacterized protein n=1 Tax=Podoviridae sp. ct90d35 TaxID=2827724 RepID=A0A8S5TNG9_9CAUD|nr:MAG TPA: hypothetical protein [Podoviridae sp. ct90d35]
MWVSVWPLLCARQGRLLRGCMQILNGFTVVMRGDKAKRSEPTQNK